MTSITGTVSGLVSSKVRASGNWCYISLFRPVTAASLPPRVTWQFIEAPFAEAWKHPTLPTSSHRYGIFQTNRQLTSGELTTYQLIKA